ncbi:MAG: ABC transporter ATP-binding protein [Acidobacteriota bacterium]|nr:ABC transporter ATP-binding protein [Acidobacteriota bacterium]
MALTQPPLLRVRDLRVRLGRREILRGVDLELRPGELVALAGPNGAGKTTLLRAIAGLLPPFAGGVTLAGRPATALQRRELARHLAYLPQDSVSAFSLSVEQTVLLGRYAHAGALRGYTREDRLTAERAMTVSDVAHLRHRLVATLSGGERRRVFLARAIAQASGVLVFDEPTSALDVGHACSVLDLLRELADAGKAVLFSLHDLALAVRGPDRLLLMDQGEIVDRGAPDKVLTGSQARRAFGIALVVTRDPPGVVPAGGRGRGEVHTAGRVNGAGHPTPPAEGRAGSG